MLTGNQVNSLVGGSTEQHCPHPFALCSKFSVDLGEQVDQLYACVGFSCTCDMKQKLISVNLHINVDSLPNMHTFTLSTEVVSR